LILLSLFQGCIKEELNDVQTIIYEITTNISSPTTWTSNTVYIIKKWDFQITSNLTIEPDTIIKFHPDEGPSISITNNGNIIAKGTHDKPIIFTSYKDDEQGGDTNNDGKSIPKASDWKGIYIEEPDSIFEYCCFYYSGPDGAIEIWDTTVNITNCIFAYNNGSALNAHKATEGTKITNNTFYKNEKPLSISAVINIDDSNTFHNPKKPLQTNTYNGIFLEYTNSIRTNVSWQETDVAFVIDHNDLWIEEDATLTLGDNVILKFTPGSKITHYHNIINHDGSGVIFTSYLDDTYGGDTNNDGATTTPIDGKWKFYNLGEETVWSNVYYAGDKKPGVTGPDANMMPVIAFWSDPPLIPQGESATIHWNVYFSNEILLDNQEVPADGQITVSPSTSTVYELVARSGDITVRSDTMVLVQENNTYIQLPEDPGIVQPQPVSGHILSGLSAQQTVGAEDPLHVRITLDSLFCKAESVWDHGTNSDENYMLVTGFATHLTPNAWSTGNPHLFDDIDSGENRRFRASQRLVYEGEIPPDEVIGFNVVLFEQDGWGNSIHQDMSDWLTSEVAIGVGAAVGAAIGTAMIPLIGTAVGAAVGSFLQWTFGYLFDAIAGGGDDFVAEETVILSYDYLYQCSQEDVHKAMVLDLNGGDEGIFELRWHIEFDRDASSAFAHRFTNWDELVVGDLIGDSKDEIVIVIDEDASGNNGRFYILDERGTPLSVFDGFYTHNDRVAIGDICLDASNELIVSSTKNGGRLYVYDSDGEELIYLPSEKYRFTKYDGFAVGMVLIGETKEQILVANDGEDKVYLFNNLGRDLGSFELNWGFDGCRYTVNHPDSNRHDVFLVGDVMGDSREEIVMIDWHNEESVVYVYNSYGHYGHKLQKTFTVYLSKYDGAILADILGNSKKELVIGTDGGDRSKAYALRIYDIEGGEQISTRHWPLFTKYDGFASGNIFGPGKHSLVIGTNQDNIVYIGK
jgi:hypothetical protein